MTIQQTIIAPTMTSQVRDMVYLLGQQQAPDIFSSFIMVNTAGIKAKVTLNDSGTSLIVTTL